MFILEKIKLTLLTLMQTLSFKNLNVEIVLSAILIKNKFKLFDSQIVKFVDRQMIRMTNYLLKDKFLGPV